MRESPCLLIFGTKSKSRRKCCRVGRPSHAQRGSELASAQCRTCLKAAAARAQSEPTTRSRLDVDPLAAVARSVPAFDGKFRHAVPVEN